MPSRDVAAERAPDASRAKTADGDASPLAVVDHRLRDARPPDDRAWLSDRSPPGDLGDGRPVDLGEIGLLDRHLAGVTSRRQ
jgi:hypothetical protein